MRGEHVLAEPWRGTGASLLFPIRVDMAGNGPARGVAGVAGSPGEGEWRGPGLVEWRECSAGQ